uniref:TIGR02234 family membrane protein n=1 Tax=Nonomuraea pusilla TaxID=46177 RepID=UPI0006E12619|nr:TIGR02234 family membrane protein [Nonomuraea pusilla]
MSGEQGAAPGDAAGRAGRVPGGAAGGPAEAGAAAGEPVEAGAAGAGRAAGRREMVACLGLTALGCLLVLLAGGRDWVRVTSGGVTVPTGGELSPVLTPLALAALAGVVAVLATKGAGRRIVGALVALCGAGAGLGVWSALGADGVAAWLRERNVLRGASEIPWEAVPLWPVVAGAGAALVLAGGVLTALRGTRWAGMSARYERAASTSAAEGRKAAGRDDRDLWDALDRGDDPTDSR